MAIFFNFTSAPWLAELQLHYEADSALRAEHPNDAQVHLRAAKAAQGVLELTCCVLQWWLPDAPGIAAHAFNVKGAADMLKHLQRMSKSELAGRLQRVQRS